ncbi:hypothetical protein ACKGJY_08670 [Hyunsoonleella sp. 2307UL5-6]|uniref:hypothetical protein n=1 Tax=Hyunsoonleella sp. 2307UL5-6 TaxID=3384768 RepID=UPI0039BD87CA
MKYVLLIIITLAVQFEVRSQEVALNKVRLESDSTIKIVYVQIKIDGVKLDSLNRIKLLGNASVFTDESKEYISDWFYSDDYLDNYDNNYTIVFDSIPNQVNKFKRISGTLRLFNPSEEKSSIVRVSNDESTFNSNIISQNSNNIKVVPIDGFLLHKLKWKKRKIRKYIAEIINQNQLNEVLLLKTLSQYFEQNKKTKFLKKVSDYILFYIEKENFEVMSISIDDTTKNEKRYVSSKLNGPKSAIWSFINYKPKLNNNFIMEVIYENAESITEFNFELLDVDLK